MMSEVDSTKWFELLQDDSDEDVLAYTTGLSETSLKSARNLTGSGCNQTSATNRTCTDPALSQYSLEETSCEGRPDLDFTKADVECSGLQFKPLPFDESRGGKLAEFSTESEAKGYGSSDKSVSNLSEYPVEALELPLDDAGHSETEDSSACEEFLNTAISEVSKDFITGNLSSYNLQSEESDVSTDDQKVHHRFMGGRYPETAVGMSDSDWNVTESDNNTSPRVERHRTETTMSSLSAFSPPLSSTVLTNQSTVSTGHRPGLSIIQEASVENTCSFKEIPQDVTSMSTSRYSFLGRDHNKYLTSPNQKKPSDFSKSGAASTTGLSSTHLLKSSLITPELAASKLPEWEENQIRDKSYSSGVSSFASRSNEMSASANVSYVPSVTSAFSGKVPSRLDNLPSTIDLAKRSEMILYRTLSKLKGRGPEGRYSLPLPYSGTLQHDTYKRHSFGLVENKLFSESRANYLPSRSSISNPGEDSVRLEKARHVESDDSAFMARELNSGATVLSKSDCDSGMTQELEEAKSHRLFASKEMLTQASRHSRSLEKWNRSANNSVEQLTYPDVEDRLPPPPPEESGPVPSEEPLPPPPGEDECSASLDYRKLQEDLQEIQNSLHNNLDFADSGYEYEQEQVFAKEKVRNAATDLEVDRPVQTPVSSENDSEIIPSNTTTPERSRPQLYGCTVNLARRDFGSRELEALGTDSETQRQSYVDRAQVAENAARRQRYNSEGEETHTSGSSNTRGEEMIQPDRIDEVTGDLGRNVNDLNRGQAGGRGSMSDSVSMILQGQDPQKQVSGILNEVRASEQEMLTQLSNRPKIESSFSDTSANVSNRSLILTENDVRKKLEMSGLSSPDRSRTYQNMSLSEFATPRKVVGPFSALSSAQDFLSHQLEEMSNKTFNHSVELRSPLQRHMYQVYPVYGFSKEEEEKNTTSSSYVPTTERREESLAHDTAGSREPVEAHLRDEELAADAVSHSTHSITDRRFASSLSREPEEARLPDEISSRLELVPDAVQGAESTHSITDRRFAASLSRISSDHELPMDRGHEPEKFGSEISNQQPTSEKQSSTFGRDVSPIEFEQSSGLQKDRLRPYRPAGSRDLYYTESDTGSLAESITTMESTHTGSDDAVAPYFPPHILGSRQDGPPPMPRKVPTPGLTSEHALSTIEEKSISEEKGRASFDSSLTRQKDRGLRQEGTEYREKPGNVPQLSQHDEGESGIGTKSNFSSYEISERNRVSHTQEQFTDRVTDGFPQEAYSGGRVLDKPYQSSRPSEQTQISRSFPESEAPPRSVLGDSGHPQTGRSESNGQGLTMSLQTSPIQPSTRRESQLEADPRHSTAVDTSSYERGPLFSGNAESGHYSVHSQALESPGDWREEGSSKGSSQKSGKENRSRSAEKKESRQRIEHQRNSRRGELPNSSSEDDSNRTIDRAPVSRPAQLLREALEQELDTEIPADIDSLWKRFQELNKTDSDTSLNTSRMETLSHLLQNPAKHLVTSYFEDKERQRKLEEDRAGQDRERRRKERQIDKDAQHVNVNVKTSEGKKRSSKRSSKSRDEPESESLCAIPEDSSFSNKQPKGFSLTDPNMQKIREKIERQKEKINRERRKELRRMEKLIKLEQLLSAKKTGKISDSTLTDQLESISTTSAPTDSMTEDVTDSTLTVSGTSSGTLTDETTTAKDSSIEMQLVKYARSRDESASYSQSPSELQHSREVSQRQSRNRKVEKARENEKLKERGKNAQRRGKKSEEEALYDYKNVHIEIIDKPERKRHSPSRIRERSTMQDAATNYPSPVNNSQYSPQSSRKQKQRKTKSEGVQTSPKWRHRPKSRSPSPSMRDDQGVISVPFILQEKMSRSQSPPYSRRFTPESLASQLPKQKRKLPISPKGIAWYIDAKDSKPWRQPLKERQAFALKQAWVPESEPNWQTHEPDDIVDNEENVREKRLTDVEKVYEISKLLPKISSQGKPTSLQEAFKTKMYKFISKSRERQKRMALAAEHRRMQDALRQERERLFGDTRKAETNQNVHPYSENLLRPKKRIFTRQEQKEMTQKMYQRLPEVIKREQDKKKENEYKLNRLKARVFNKRVQRRVLMKAQVY